ncbi:MAG: RNA polymerase sigma factor [Kiritimatiellia bacterium]|nr:RNA polymerase sigma factor [Lentisphaerota bacterium]
MEVSDEDLAREYVGSGALNVLDILVARHVANVRNLVFPMVLNKADADDLTQETFVKAVAALPKFRYRSSFKTWIYRIAVNTTRDFMRKRGRLLLELRNEMPETKYSRRGPADAAISREETARLLSVIGRLSPCLRRAFVLVSVNEFSPGEAAKIEGCLTATMYHRPSTLLVCKQQISSRLRVKIASDKALAAVMCRGRSRRGMRCGYALLGAPGAR